MMQTINEAQILKEYFIHSINLNLNEEIGIRLNHLGFLPGEPIKVLRKTPITGDSLLITVRGTQMALTKNEAQLIVISEFI